MDRLPVQITLLVSLVFSLIWLSIMLKGLFLKQLSKFNKKSRANKLLLKKLLEGFGLDVPSELNELEGSVLNSIKGP